jgi:hypothetical protein
MRLIRHLAPIAFAISLSACSGNADNSPVGEADNGNITPGNVAPAETENSTGVPRDGAPATQASDNGASG